MKLSNRLLSIALLASKYKTIADVGCDHGKLDLFLAKQYNINTIASDISKNSIENLKKIVDEQHFNNKIKVVLSDGISHLKEKVDAIVISGMGTRTMIEIFEHDKEIFLDTSSYILSSQHDLVLLRKYMCKNGFLIKDEVMVHENNKYYSIILFEKGDSCYTNLEFRYGPMFLKKREAIFLKFLNQQLQKKEEILKNISSYSKDAYLLKKEIKELKKLL